MVLEFRHKLEALINEQSMESVSDTPDFILCQYLMDALAAFDKAVVAREKWYGRNKPDERIIVPVPSDAA